MSTAKQRPTVYIEDENSFDYSPAQAYGDIVVLRSQRFAAGLGADDAWNANIKHSLRKQLVDYRPMVDFVIPTGDPLKMNLVAGLLVKGYGDRHQFLKWDMKAYRYVLHVLDYS